MTAIEQAIREAVEKGGYKHRIFERVDTMAEPGFREVVFNNPFFWQALGKARGWSDKNFRQVTGRPWTTKNPNGGPVGTSWKREWHRFIDNLANGGTPESFFASLPTTPNTKI